MVRRDILLAFEYSYAHADWVTPLDEALDGITVAETLWKPRRLRNCSTGATANTASFPI